MNSTRFDPQALPPLLAKRRLIPLDPRQRTALLRSMIHLQQFRTWYDTMGLGCDLAVEIPKFGEFYAGREIDPFIMLKRWLQSEKCSHNGPQGEAVLEAFLREEI